MTNELVAEARETAQENGQSQVGRFVWYELMTSDMDAAERFYASVVGWRTEDSGLPGMRYTFLKAGNEPIGGLTTVPADEAGAEPGWIGYIGVADVDQAARKLSAAGGTVHRQPDDIPEVGRFAMVADPGGAMFFLFTPLDAPGSAADPKPMTPGHIGWHELYAAQGGDAALTFYGDQFGWTRDGDMDMGPMGKYRFFATGGPMVGGVMDKPAEAPVGAWQFYFIVDAIDAAVERIKAGGGRITQEPMEVPGGSWVVTGTDPQGAHFALTAAGR